MHGLTFIAMSQHKATQRRWQEEATARQSRRPRLTQEDTLSAEERNTLDAITEQLKLATLRESKRKCLECGRPFNLVHVGGIELDCCPFCRSMWFDPSENRNFSSQSKEIPSDHLASRRSKYSCPDCHAQLTEYVFLNPNTLLVDRCPNNHGVYLEDRELERVFEIT